MVTPRATRSRHSYAKIYNKEECYQSTNMSSSIRSQTRPPPTLRHKERFPYESVLRTGCLGGRGRLGEAAPVARAASRAGAHNVLGGRRWQRRPRVGWRAACVQAVVGLVRLDAAEALPPVSAVLTRPPCRRGVREGHRRRGEPPACSTRATCASHALADGSTRV